MPVAEAATTASRWSRVLVGARRGLSDPQLWIALIGLVVLAWLAMPEIGRAVRFADTNSYLRWPAPMIHKGVELMGARAAGYPLVLKWLGVGPSLVQFQWLLSLGCWGYLGWKLARGPGAVLGGLLSLAPALACWSMGALADSISISLSAFLLALSIDLDRPLRIGHNVMWLLGILAFVLLRDVNLLFVPFLCIPLLAHRERRVLVLLAVVVTILAGVAWDISRNHRGSLYTQHAIYGFVGPSKEAGAWFVERGMPRPPAGSARRQILYDWLNDDGVWLYRYWATTNRVFYADTWRLLTQPDGSTRLDEAYFPDVRSSASPTLASAGGFLYLACAPLRSVWLCLLLLPALDYWRNRRIGTPALLAAGLVMGTYVQGFVAYVSDSLETHRHMIGAFVLYRFAALVGLYAIVDIIRSPTRESGVVSWIGRRKEPAPSAVPRDTANQGLRTLEAYPSASVQGPRQRRPTANPTTH
jgi:hypothetical protein